MFTMDIDARTGDLEQLLSYTEKDKKLYHKEPCGGRLRLFSPWVSQLDARN